MLYTNIPRFVVLVFSIMACTVLSAQTTKQAVILYNSSPVKAEITSDGFVNKIISEEPNFLSGFVLTIQDYAHYQELLAKSAVAHNQNLSQTRSGTEVVNTANEKEESQPAETIVEKKADAPNVSYIAENDRLTKSILFENDKATLTEGIIKVLDEVIAYLKENQGKKVIAMTLSRYENSRMSQGRQNSIRLYLNIRGIDQDRLLFQSYFADIDLNLVKLQIVD